MIDEKFYQDFGEAITKYIKGLNLKPIMPEIEALMNFSFHEQFLTEGQFFNRSKWSPLAPSTVKQREKIGYWPGSILQQTGGLASSIGSSYGNNFELLVGPSREYAKYLHFGTSRMPARPILPTMLPITILEEIAEVVGRYLMK